MHSIEEYQAIIDPTHMEYYLNDKSFAPLRKLPICIAASVYRMSAGNCMPYNKQLHPQEENKLFTTVYKSPWENYLQRNKKLEDSGSSSSSTLDSSCSSSSRSESPEPQKKHKKKSYHMLLREIRRLRNENSSLRTSVSMLKNDLRDINVSRQDTDASHKKFYDEYMDKNTQLEIDIEDRNDEIKSLKQEIDRLKQCHLCHSNNSHHRASSSGNHHNPFGCYEYDEDEDIFCQPVAHESALPEIDIKMDELKVDDADDEDARAMNDYLHRRFNLVDISQQEEEDEEEEDVKDDLALFEPTATSYIHQAMISKLSSTRVRLELDDLILKYEPSCEDIVRVLSYSFVDWVSSLLVKFVNKSGPEPVSATKVFTSHIQNGIVEFWESLLQYYTSEEDCQIDLLNRIEHDIDIIPSGTAIGDHFDRLVLMLYKYHVIDDDAVISWWQNPLDNENSRKIRKITTRFVEWVQDEEDDEEDEDDSDQEGDNDDEDGDDDDDDGMFSFVESPVSEDQIELNNESSDNELEVNQTDGSSSIDALLTNQDRELCVCHLDKDTSTMPKKNEPCSCSTYTPSPVIEKKKKSVRIAM